MLNNKIQIIGFAAGFLGAVVVVVYGLLGLVNQPALTELSRANSYTSHKIVHVMREGEICAVKVFVDDSAYVHLGKGQIGFDELYQATRSNGYYSIAYDKDMEFYELTVGGETYSSFAQKTFRSRVVDVSMTLLGSLFCLTIFLEVMRLRRMVGSIPNIPVNGGEKLATWSSGVIRQSFELPDQNKFVFYVMGLVLLGIASLCCWYIPVLVVDGNVEGAIVLTVSGLFFCGYMGYMLYYSIKHAKDFDLVVDRDGIWLKNYQKAATLVPFSEIYFQRVNPLFRRCELLGRQGQLLIRVSWELGNFTNLEKQLNNFFISNRINLNQCIAYQRSVFEQFSYWFLFIFIAAFSLLTDSPALIAASFLVLAVSMLFYFKTVVQISADADSFYIRYPIRTSRLPFENIKSIQRTNIAGPDGRSETGIVLNDGSCIKVTGVSYQGIELARLLQHILEANRTRQKSDGQMIPHQI